MQGSDERWYSALELCAPAAPEENSESSFLSDVEAALASVVCRQLGWAGGRPARAYLPGTELQGGGGRDNTLSALLLCSGNETAVDQASAQLSAP